MVSITDPIRDDGAVKYKVCIEHPVHSGQTLSHVYRRYSEFETVFRRLVDLKPDPPLPPVPEKKVFGATDPAFVERRRRELENFMHCVCSNRFLVSDLELLTLIGYDLAKNALALETKQSVSPARHQSPRGARVSKQVLEVPHEDQPTQLWIRPSIVVGDEANLLAAQQFLRSTSYSLERPLLQISFRPARKTFFLLRDTCGNTNAVLSVVQPVADLSIDIDDGKRVANVERLLGALCGSFLAPVLQATFVAGRWFVIRSASKHGSLRDKMYNASWSDESIQKFSAKGKPFKKDDIAMYGKQILLAVRTLHDYNIPTPVHLGNCLLESGGLVTLSDIEDHLFGVCMYPCALPFVDGEALPKTHMDILRFGSLLIEMALGSPLTTVREAELVGWLGDPCGVDDDGVLRSVDELCSSLPKSVPTEIIELVRLIFGPKKVECKTLLEHSFFQRARFKGDLKKMEAIAFEHVPLKLKRKDVELFVEANAKWLSAVENARSLAARGAEDRQAVRELKRKVRSFTHHSPSKDRGDYSAPSVGQDTPIGNPGSAAPTPLPQSTEVPSAVAPPPPAKGAPPPPPPPAKGAPPPPPPPPKGVPPPPPPPPRK